MAVTFNPYLHFNGNAEEALHFYSKVFGVEGTISRYGDNPTPDLKEEDKNLVMHGDLQADGIRLMLSDSGPMGPGTKGADEARLTQVYNKLCEGGKVIVPLSKAGWGDTFGMCTDKYGFTWFVNISA
jgi:PhnB protein